MAEEDEEGGAGGGTGKRRALSLPTWAWAVIVGGGAAVLWYVRNRRSASSDTTATAPTSNADSTGDQQDIIPLEQGLSESQYEALLAAIQKLQGPPSTGLGGQTTTFPGQINGPGPVHVPVPTPAPAHTISAPTQYKPPPNPKSVKKMRTYTVKRNDTLSLIAKREGVSLTALERANPRIKNPNRIYPNQIINIP